MEVGERASEKTERREDGIAIGGREEREGRGEKDEREESRDGEMLSGEGSRWCRERCGKRDGWNGKRRGRGRREREDG